jgi:hypothetical protein
MQNVMLGVTHKTELEILIYFKIFKHMNIDRSGGGLLLSVIITRLLSKLLSEKQYQKSV